MASTLLRETEFIVYRGVRIYGSCGPNAGGAVLRRAAQDDRYTTLFMVNAMYGWGLCSSQGVTQPGHLRDALEKLGFQTVYSGFYKPWSGWLSFLMTHVAQRGNPAFIESSNGQAFIDAISGKGENARNLEYHFIAVLEYHPGGFSKRAGRVLPQGFWCADGDNFAVGNVLQFYPLSVLAAIKPVAATAVTRKVNYPLLDASDGSPAPSPTPVSGSKGASSMLSLSDPEVARYFVASGSDWQRYMIDPASKEKKPVLDPATHQPIVIKAGPMLDFYRSLPLGTYAGLSWPGLPLANAMPIAGHAGITYQPYERGDLADDAARAYDAPPGFTGPIYPTHIDSGVALDYLTAHATAPLQAEVNTLTGDKASLTKQLETAQSISAALTDKLTKASAAVKSLAGLLG